LSLGLLGNEALFELAFGAHRDVLAHDQRPRSDVMGEEGRRRSASALSAEINRLPQIIMLWSSPDLSSRYTDGRDNLKVAQNSATV
jgi:hypothetical protein